MRTEVFEQCRMDIRFYLVDIEDFHTALQMLNNLKSKILKEGNYPNSQMYYIYFNSGYCFKRLKQYDKALELLKTALQYTDGGNDMNYSYTWWMIANIYTELGDKKLSKSCFLKRSSFFKKNNKLADRLLVLMNIAQIDNNFRRMYHIVSYILELSEEELLYNTTVNTDKLINEIIRMCNEMNQIKSEDSFYYKKIVKKLKSSNIPMIRKNLLALSVNSLNK